jgi:hypothetical protein
MEDGLLDDVINFRCQQQAVRLAIDIVLNHMIDQIKGIPQKLWIVN